MAEQSVGQIASVAIAATFTAEPLQPALELILREAGLQLNLRFAPYHQVLQELISTTGTLAANLKGVNVVLVRFEDFVRDITDSAQAQNVIAGAANEITDALGEFVRRSKVPAVLAIFTASPATRRELHALIDAANKQVLASVDGLPGLSLVLQADVDAISVGERY